MKKLFLMAVTSLLITSCNGQQEGKIQTMAPLEYSRKLQSMPDVQLIDVRTPQEYAGQHIERAVNIDVNSADFDKKMASLDKSKPVFVYCMVGGRSHKAATKLKEMGFAEVYDLEGGIMKWNAEGFGKPATGGMTKADYDKLVTSDKKILISFFAEWCGPCKKMAPYMTALEQDQTDDVKVVRLDADQNKALAQQLKVQALPTLMLYIDGKQTWQHTGFISEADLKNRLK